MDDTLGDIERCECGMPHLGGTEHADECPAGVYVPGLGGGSEVEALRQQLGGAVEALREIYAYASGASGVTGDDAGHLTEIGLMARDALTITGGQS